MKTVLRFIATGDLQVHAWRQFSYTRKNGMNSRLYFCLKVLDILGKEAEARGIDKILINGDVFEENTYIEVEVYDEVYLRLEKLHDAGMDTVINLGNHDVLRESGRRVLHTLRSFRKVATIVEEPKSVWGVLSVVPWMADAQSIKKAIRGLAASKEMGLALHCGVQGARTGPTSYLVRNPIKLRDIRATDFGFVLLSDYHTRQKLARNVYYLGSPIQHSFGEIHRPAIWDIRVLDVAPWYIAKRIYTDLPRFKSVYIRRLSDFKDKLDSFSGNYIRAILSADSKVLEEDLERLASGRFQLQVDREDEGRDVVSNGDVHTMDPEEAIFRYTEFHSSVGKRSRLVQLGKKLYHGEN
jgi:hypothetical protein